MYLIFIIVKFLVGLGFLEFKVGFCGFSEEVMVYLKLL